mmetsp:Transcript_18635/g.28782  ORF Transcript_18635/g.28782 Transcript_18635/m.28782 type:complete len:637 (-) Transcript_18635:59-1969(-)
MADCTASGTAVDRVIQSAVASALRQGSASDAATSSAAAAASRQAAQAFGSLGAVLGGTAATSAATMAAPTQSIMPMAAPEMIGQRSSHHSSGGMMTMPNTAMMDNQQRLEDAWSSSSSTTANNVTAVAHHGSMHHPVQQQQMFHHPSMQMQMHPQQQMMMQQQQQMAMMQHMQMQQQQMAAMVQYQQQQQQQQKAAATTTHTNINITEEQHQVFQEDDVATVSSQDELNHEGFTEHASIERLAQAWRDAEAEYAEEFDNDDVDAEYDVSNIAGLYNTDATTAAAGDLNHDATTAEPHYEFSEGSRLFGCVTTPLTDIAPTLNDTTDAATNNFPEDLFEQGIQHFEEGNISEAILCFESTLRNIDPEHADAWRMLGRCHTENDEDSKAIVCMMRSIERDPYSPETLLALGVAYVNELDHERAVETLKSWVANHPLYAGMDMAGALKEEEDLYGSEDHDIDEGARRGMREQTMAEMRDVERLLLRVLDIDNTADAAADVYEALGVVYNVSRDYDAAVDSFRRAIEVRPDDYQLRNKLGATLANSNRSEEALSSYHMALSLKPKYARGWLNMAIAHSNLHNYSEASRCYLQTLSLNQEAKHVWSYLRIALTCDEQWDLLPLAASQNLSAFHEHFDFVEY